MELFQGSHSILGWNESRGVILSWDGTTPVESFSPGMKRLQETPSVMEWNDSRGVSPGGTPPQESFCPGVDRLLGSHSVLGWNDSRGVILSWDTRTPGE